MEDINVKGKFERNSDVLCNSVNVNGKLCVNGDIKANTNINVNGKMVANNVNSNMLSVKGNILTKNITCNSLEVDGKIVARNIKSETVKISAGEDSVIKFISGKKLRIEGDIKNKEVEKQFVKKFLEKFALSVDDSNINKGEKCNIKSIEADYVFLKNVKVDKVICKKADILEECEIETLIYSDDANISDSANVKNKKRR